MIYIIMCGGTYTKFKIPRQLLMINGEPIVERTIRLLRQNGAKDIFVSANDLKHFSHLSVPMIYNGADEDFICNGYNDNTGMWVDAFVPYPGDVTYIMGDVVFSDKAIETIVMIHSCKVHGITFFASCPPFNSDIYPKPYGEPFAFKVENYHHFRKSIEKVKEYHKAGYFTRHPIAWELWNVCDEVPLNHINDIRYGSYVAINDYTCDVDDTSDIDEIKKAMEAYYERKDV